MSGVGDELNCTDYGAGEAGVAGSGVSSFFLPPCFFVILSKITCWAGVRRVRILSFAASLIAVDFSFDSSLGSFSFLMASSCASRASRADLTWAFWGSVRVRREERSSSSALELSAVFCSLAVSLLPPDLPPDLPPPPPPPPFWATALVAARAVARTRDKEGYVLLH